jgi:hypothetical protein
MQKTILTTITLVLVSTFVFGQNRMKFKHKLSQNMITSSGFVLRDGAGNPLAIGGTNRLKCVIRLNSNGVILVDFWRINPATDPFAGVPGIVNSTTPFNLAALPTLSDGRATIGQPTRVLKVPFSALTFGVAVIPFRLRGEHPISSSEKSKMTVTSPRPDIAFTGGWTLGKSTITNRSIINHSATFGAFLGLTSAEIKNGVVSSTSPLYGTSKTQVNPALSYGASVTLARNNLGLVVAFGFDNSFGDYSNDWIYQNKLWLGVGLSASLGFF